MACPIISWGFLDFVILFFSSKYMNVYLKIKLFYSYNFLVSCFLSFRVCSTIFFLSVFYDFAILFSLLTFYFYKAIHTHCSRLENKNKQKQNHKITFQPPNITCTIPLNGYSTYPLDIFHTYINIHIHNSFLII